MKPQLKERIYAAVLILIAFGFGFGFGIQVGTYSEPVPNTMRWVAPRKIAVLKMAIEELESSRGMLEQMYQQINDLQSEVDSLDQYIAEEEPRQWRKARAKAGWDAPDSAVSSQ